MGRSSWKPPPEAAVVGLRTALLRRRGAARWLRHVDLLDPGVRRWQNLPLLHLLHAISPLPQTVGQESYPPPSKFVLVADGGRYAMQVRSHTTAMLPCAVTIMLALHGEQPEPLRTMWRPSAGVLHGIIARGSGWGSFLCFVSEAAGQQGAPQVRWAVW